MSNSYDAIVVGGGHNGLVAAAYLARGRCPHGRARGAVDDRRRRDDRGAVAGGARRQGDPAVLRDEPDAADDPRGPRSWTRHGYQVHPMGPYYQAFPEGGSLTIHERRPRSARTTQIAKWSRKDADAMAEWNAWLAGLADVLGPLLLTVPPDDRLAPARRPRGTLRARLAQPGPRRAHRRRRDPADDDEHRRPARRLVRVAAGQGRAGRQRRHRHLGRARTSPARPTSWRTTRSATSATGSSAAGASPRAAWAPCPQRSAARPSRSVPRSAPTRRSSGCSCTTAGSSGAVLDDGRSCARRSSSPACTRRSRSSTTSAARDLPDDFVRDIERWRSRSGVVKVNLALGRAARLHRRPAAPSWPSTTPARSRWRRAWSSSSGRSRTRARAGRRRAPFCDGVIPTTLDQTLAPRARTSCRCSPSGCRATGARSRTRRSSRRTPTACIDLYDEVAPNFKASILHRDVVGPLRDGARVRPDRRQHLPRRAVARAAVPHAAGAGLRRLPHPDRTGSTTRARRRTPAAASAASRACRRPRAAIADRKSAARPRRAVCRGCSAPGGDRSRRSADACGPCSRPARSRSSAPARDRAASASGSCTEVAAQPERARRSTWSTRGTTRCSAGPA